MDDYKNKYWSKNTGAICYLICKDLLDPEQDLEITRNYDGFVVIAFVPTDARMDAFRFYVNAFREREELLLDIVAYNSIFGTIKHRINAFKTENGLK